MNIERILVPVDFSHHATGAMRLAVAVANRFKAQVTALHVDPLPGIGTVVVEPIFIAPQLFEGLHAEHDARVEAGLREIRDEFAPLAGDGVTITAERRRGEAVDGIVSMAREWRADLIVMGSQGVSGFAQLLLGSTADKVSRVAPCPVLIAGRAADDSDSAPRPFRRVLAAVDYSRFSPAVARLGATLTEPDGTLELLHVWNPPHVSALDGSLGGQREDIRTMIEGGLNAEAERIQAFSARLALPRVRVEPAVVPGTPAKGILERAEDIGADLIVLGAHSRSGLNQRILGTVADRVLRHAKVPVLLCPEDALERE